MKKHLFALILICLSTGCAAGQPASPPPALIKPAVVKADTAIVSRGDILVMDQYKAFTRVESEGLFFGETSLVFREYAVMTGQQVKKGDLLAVLDTEPIEEDIEDLKESTAKMLREHEFANEAALIAIDTARAEYVKLVRESGLDEESVFKAENKRAETAAAELAFKHQKERQALSVLQEEEKLSKLKEKLPPAELRAPYDGEICLIIEKLPGDAVEPYKPVIYITDKQKPFIEVIVEGGSVSARASAKCFYMGREYDLERVALSRQETLFFSTMHVTAPVRYKIAPGQADPPPLGAFMTVRVSSDEAKNVLRIPFNALYSDSELGLYVYRIEDGAKVPAYIKSDLRNDAFAEVREGLEEGDEVFVK